MIVVRNGKMKSTTVFLLKSLTCADSLVLSIGIFLLKYSQKSNARRAGDSDPSKSIIAHSWKKLANSAYGSLLMNKETQTDVVFVEEQVNARRKVNDTCLEKKTHTFGSTTLLSVKWQSVPWRWTPRTIWDFSC